MTSKGTRGVALVAVLLAAAAILFFLNASTGPRVVVYCALDREFADDVLDEFTRRWGVAVERSYDTEANKSVGLYNNLIREATRPRCDVHWNNEILATIRLQQKDIYAPYESPAALPFPAKFKAADHTWTAFAARARVLIVNTKNVSAGDMPAGLDDLLKPRWKGRIAMAKPLFGTTATQAACWFQAWGADKARDFFQKLKANDVQIVPGNKQVAVGVGVGQFDVGLTDTDDAFAELDQGRPVAMVFPDRDAAPETKRGTLVIPNTVAMIRNCPNPDGAKKLIDYLLSPEVEAKLAQGASRQLPLNPDVKVDLPPALQAARSARLLDVDFARAADAWDESQPFLRELFALR